MGSDRARNTFDRVKQYRRVVAQQGRVELEADKNEGAEIATEALRLVTIVVVGTYGVPSDPITDVIGTVYKIEAADPIIPGPPGDLPPPDFQLLPGTIHDSAWPVVQE